ncbi:MAG: D-alanyl-D-alanine carboxypeptidase, partial [Peptoanaerobacter stomatis]
MKLKNRILFLLFIIFMSIQNISYAIEPPPTQEEISGEAAILMENETGKILYEKNAYKKMYPASTTKVMTALLALEKLDLDKKIAVPPDFPQVDGSSMYLL